MIDYEEARRLALDHLSGLEEESRKIVDLRKDLTLGERGNLGLPRKDDVLEFALMEDATIEGDFGWVFFWNSRAFLGSQDDRHALGGNAPIIVSRRDGSLHSTGTARPIDFYIENFRRSGNTLG